MTPQERHEAEKKVEAVLFVIDTANDLFPEIADALVRVLPAVLTAEFGHPVHPDLVSDLHDAVQRSEAGEDHIEIRQWEDRAADLMYKIVSGPAVRSA